MLTKPQVTKGVASQFSLDKSQLLTLPIVQADNYFSEPLNWYRINAVYKSSEGGQYELVEFDATQSNPTGTFLISERARNEFLIEKLIIVDFDKGFLEIPRSELTVSDWDVQILGNTPTILLENTVHDTLVSRLRGNSPTWDFGQHFTLYSTIHVSSIKIMLAGIDLSGRGYSPPMSGTLKLKLVNTTGEEFQSTTIYNLNQTQFYSSGYGDGYIVEFLFENVQLNPGTCSFKSILLDVTFDYNTDVAVFGSSSNPFSDGSYLYNNSSINDNPYDIWFQILGTSN